MESALLWRRKLSTEEVDVVRISGPRPSMARSGERGVGGADTPPLVTADVVDVEIIIKLGERTVEVLSSKEQQTVAVMR